jgi:hypothetical protein
MFKKGYTSVNDAEHQECTSTSTALKKIKEARATDHRQEESPS